jgi:hypothetical protein
MKNYQHLSMIAVALLLIAGNASAQSFTNGSFEPTAPGQFVNGGDDKMINNAAPGWTINTGSPDWMYGPGVVLWDTNWGDYFQIGGAYDPPTGLGGALPPFAPLAFREGVGQAVSGFAPGSLYQVSFSHTNGFVETPLVPGSQGGWELFIDSTSVFVAPSTNVIGGIFPLPHTTDWQTSTFTFQATSATHTFDFLSYSPGLPQPPSYQWLDNVSVAPIPEPASAALIGLGSLVLLGKRRSTE